MARRPILRTGLGQAEARSAMLIDRLLDDPRLAVIPRDRAQTAAPLIRSERLELP